MKPSPIPFWKTALDTTVAVLGLVVLAPVFVVIAVLVKLDSKGPVFFRQERMGLGLRAFWIYKFRTMVADAPSKGGQITAGADPRITRVGTVLRKLKVDELPQLINVLRGEMSLVGPRPEVRRYVELFRRDYEEILRVKPGITDLASLKYSDEASVLQKAVNPEHEYLTRLLPDKIALAKEYVRRSSLSFDVSLILRTLVKVFVSDRSSVSSSAMKEHNGNS